MCGVGCEGGGRGERGGDRGGPRAPRDPTTRGGRGDDDEWKTGEYGYGRKLTFQVSSRASRVVIIIAASRAKSAAPLREGEVFLGRLVVVLLVVGRVSQNVAWLPLPDTYRGR